MDDQRRCGLCCLQVLTVSSTHINCNKIESGAGPVTITSNCESLPLHASSVVFSCCFSTFKLTCQQQLVTQGVLYCTVIMQRSAVPRRI